MSGRAIVVGGGIGGLAAGAALARTGWDVSVHERAGALEAVGAGITLAPNALRALDEIGTGDRLRELATTQGDGGVRRPDGSWLTRTSLAAFRRRLGDEFVVAARSELIAALADRLPAGALQLGAPARVTDAGTAERRAVVAIGDGAGSEQVEADLVVAADGIRSAIRAAHLPDDPGVRYSGCTSWRFVAADAPRFHAAETWGPGRVAGLMPMTGGRVYGYLMARTPAGGSATGPRGEAGLVAELFAGWHEPIPALLASLGPDDVARHDVYEIARPLPAFHAGRVAFVGDAAHAMPPNLGQGGCMAIEDAVTLAATVAGAAGGRAGGGLAAALPAYSAARVGRTTSVLRGSRRMQRTAQLGGPAARVRDALLAPARLLSADLTVRLFFGFVDWRPPALPHRVPDAA